MIERRLGASGISSTDATRHLTVIHIQARLHNAVYNLLQPIGMLATDMSPSESETEQLRARWTHLYKGHLPALAKARDPVQKQWPVHLDHCFARIVLDNAVGLDRPWTGVIKSPAVRTMTVSQLNAAIQLAEDIATGVADLSRLNAASLEFRGKKRPAAEIVGPVQRPTKKPKGEGDTTISSYFASAPRAVVESNLIASVDSSKLSGNPSDAEAADMTIELKKIAASNLTSYRKQTLALLCKVPRGRYSTYQAMADYITKTSHKTCARAVGSAMRNNPFAPEVPCHRILAAGGTLGGFGGSWGETGKFASKKHQILHEEGVRFDSNGKVKGPPFRDFS